MKNSDSIDPRGAYETHPESNRLAEELFNKYLKGSLNSTQSILITGEQGIGKSTVKKIIKGHIDNIDSNDRKIVVVDFNAFQFEENGQVTSSFYATIGKNIGKFNRKLANNFKAVSYLKKETNLNSLSMGFVFQIMLVGLIVFLFSKISKLNSVNELLSHGFYPVSDPALGNKVLLLLCLIVIMYWMRNWILKIIAAKLPRLSHIEILQKINFGDSEVIIFVDEVDRLTSESAKYLLDELLILKDSLNFNKNISNKCTVFLFCDVSSLEIKDNKKTTFAYLRKHFDYFHTINISSIPDLIREKMDEIYYFINKEMLVSYEIYKLYTWISQHVTTFREVEKLFGQLSHEVKDQDVRNLMNIYLKRRKTSAILYHFAKNNTESNNEVYVLFTISCMYFYISKQIEIIHHSDIFRNLVELNNIQHKILSHCRDKIVFQKIIKNRDKIYSELDEIQSLQGIYANDITVFGRMINSIQEGIKVCNTFNQPNAIMQCKNQVINNLRIRISKLSIENERNALTEVLNKTNNLDEVRNIISDKLNNLKSYKENATHSGFILEICKKILEREDGIAFNNLDMYIDNIKDFKIYNKDCFRDDFKPIAELILDDIHFYIKKIDWKYNGTSTEMLTEINKFVEGSILNLKNMRV